MQTNDRSEVWELLSALAVAAVVLVAALVVGYYAYRIDQVLGHGPLPSSASAGGAYALTLLTALLSVGAGGVAVVGLVHTRGLTGRFHWFSYAIVVIVLALALLAPLARFGVDTWGGLSPFLVSVPARAVMGVMLGLVVFSGLGHTFVPMAWRGQTAVREAATAGVGGIAGRFTPSAWRVLSHMQEEAKRFEHAFMGTEHLLLALVREPQSLAARAMVNLGVDLEEVRVHIERVLGRRGSLFTGTGGLTARCRRVIEEAARLATQRGDRIVGTGHLLRGMLGESEDAASQILERMGVAPVLAAEEMERLGYETEEPAQSRVG